MLGEYKYSKVKNAQKFFADTAHAISGLFSRRSVRAVSPSEESRALSQPKRSNSGSKKPSAIEQADSPPRSESAKEDSKALKRMKEALKETGFHLFHAKSWNESFSSAYSQWMGKLKAAAHLKGTGRDAEFTKEFKSLCESGELDRFLGQDKETLERAIQDLNIIRADQPLGAETLAFKSRLQTKLGSLTQTEARKDEKRKEKLKPGAQPSKTNYAKEWQRAGGYKIDSLAKEQSGKQAAVKAAPAHTSDTGDGAPGTSRRAQPGATGAGDHPPLPGLINELNKEKEQVSGEKDLAAEKQKVKEDPPAINSESTPIAEDSIPGTSSSAKVSARDAGLEPLPPAFITKINQILLELFSQMDKAVPMKDLPSVSSQYEADILRNGIQIDGNPLLDKEKNVAKTEEQKVAERIRITKVLYEFVDRDAKMLEVLTNYVNQKSPLMMEKALQDGLMKEITLFNAPSGLPGIPKGKSFSIFNCTKDPSGDILLSVQYKTSPSNMMLVLAENGLSQEYLKPKSSEAQISFILRLKKSDCSVSLEEEGHHFSSSFNAWPRNYPCPISLDEMLGGGYEDALTEFTAYCEERKTANEFTALIAFKKLRDEVPALKKELETLKTANGIGSNDFKQKLRQFHRNLKKLDKTYLIDGSAAQANVSPDHRNSLVKATKKLELELKKEPSTIDPAVLTDALKALSNLYSDHEVLIRDGVFGTWCRDPGPVLQKAPAQKTRKQRVLEVINRKRRNLFGANNARVTVKNAKVEELLVELKSAVTSALDTIRKNLNGFLPGAEKQNVGANNASEDVTAAALFRLRDLLVKPELLAEFRANSDHQKLVGQIDALMAIQSLQRGESSSAQSGSMQDLFIRAPKILTEHHAALEDIDSHSNVRDVMKEALEFAQKAFDEFAPPSKSDRAIRIGLYRDQFDKNLGRPDTAVKTEEILKQIKNFRETPSLMAADAIIKQMRKIGKSHLADTANEIVQAARKMLEQALATAQQRLMESLQDSLEGSPSQQASGIDA